MDCDCVPLLAGNRAGCVYRAPKAAMREAGGEESPRSPIGAGRREASVAVAGDPVAAREAESTPCSIKAATHVSRALVAEPSVRPYRYG